MTERIDERLQIVGTYDKRRTVSTMSAADAHAMATPKKIIEPSFDEVEIIAASLGYKLLNMDGKRWRLYRDGLLIDSSKYGGGLSLFDVRAYLEAERYSKRFDVEVPSAVETVRTRALGTHCQVVKDIPECGYAIATQLDAVLDEPDWFYRDDDDFDFTGLEAARARMMASLDRDCDRVANFELSLGGLV